MKDTPGPATVIVPFPNQLGRKPPGPVVRHLFSPAKTVRQTTPNRSRPCCPETPDR